MVDGSSCQVGDFCEKRQREAVSDRTRDDF